MQPEVRVRRRASQLFEHFGRVSSAVGGGLHRVDEKYAVTSVVVAFALEVELQLERLFVQLALGNRTLPDVRPLVSFSSAVVLHKHLRQGRQYAEWLPFEKHTLARADRYFSGGRPFSRMSETGKSSLRELSVIRNVLAHSSDHSQRSFEKQILSSRAVPSYERAPVNYLCGLNSALQTRLEQHLASAVAAFEELV